MFGRDLSPNAELLTRFLGNAKSIKQIRDVLNDYADHLERIDVHPKDKFGAKDKGKDSLLKRLLAGEETPAAASAAPVSAKSSDVSDKSDNNEKPDAGRFNQDSETPLLSSEEDACFFRVSGA